MHSRSVSDVPLKIRDFAIIVTDSKATYKLSAYLWTEIDNTSDEPADESEVNTINEEFMMYPNKCYKIVHAANQNQFGENSELQVRPSQHIVSVPFNQLISISVRSIFSYRLVTSNW